MRRIIGSLAALLVAWSATASDALAGTVSFNRCGDGGNGDLISYEAHGQTALVLGECGSYTLVNYTIAGQDMLAKDDYARLRIAAPKDTAIVEGTIEREIRSHAYVAHNPPDGENDSWAHGYRLVEDGGWPHEFCGATGYWPGVTACNWEQYGTFDPTSLPGPSKHFVSGGTDAINVYFGCFSPTSGLYCRMYDYSPHLNIRRIDLVIRDEKDPWAIVRGPVVDASIITEPLLEIDAIDEGLGVLDAAVLVDGHVVHRIDLDPSPACTYPDHTFKVGLPCSLDPEPMSVSVPGLPEGRHDVAIEIRDLALNTRVVRSRNVQIDLVPAPSPGTGQNRPFVSGSVREGGTLTVNPGIWSDYGRPIAFAYQWQRCPRSGGDCIDIAGATGQRYTPGALDLDALLRATVTGTTSEGSAVATTDAVGPVVGLQCFGARCEIVTVEDDKPGDSQAPFNGDGASPRARVTAGYGNKRIVRMSYGQRLMLRGRLADERGGAISGAKLDVLTRSGSLGSHYAPSAQVTTAADGTFKYLTPVGASRVVRFAYRAVQSDLEYASAADVELIVRARVGFRATKRVRAGDPVRLTGSVAGIRPGTRLEIQARDRRVWRTFTTVRTRKNGSFATRYVFKRVPRPLSYLFRVVYRKNPAVALESARSRAVRVRVRP